MKKLVCALLALVMMVGLCVGAGAAVDPQDPSTWPELVLNQPAEIEFWDYTEGDLNGSPGYPVYMSFYRFTPAESGDYYFEIPGPDTLRFRFVYVIINGTSVWDDSDIYNPAGKIARLEGGVEYIVVAQAINMVLESTGTFQVVARRVNALAWWQTLPPFLQFLLRWFAFGWLWMK